MSSALHHRAGVHLALLLVGLIVPVAGRAGAEDEAISLRWQSTEVADSASAPVISATARSTELRDALAHVVIERNLATLQRDSLLQQRWLMLGYATFASLLAVWFIRASLLRHSRSAATAATAVTASTATTRTRGNATITIRNASTQQEESTDRVATRRLFKARQSSETTTRIAPGTGTTVKTTLSPAMVKAPATAPATALIPTTPTTKAAKPDQHDYAPTDAKPTARLIGTQPSILLAPEIDDSVPETTQVRIARREGRELARQGFTLLEVMIALAILATVLASVGSGIFALTSAKQSAREETTVSDLMRSWAERMMGADWEWLGRDRIDDPLRQAWSWQRPETTAPLVRGNYPPLKEDVKDPTNNAAVQVLGTEHSGLTDLRLYLEYYQPIALELCFSPIDGAAARSLWADTRGAYQLVPPIDLRQQIDAVVVRLSATWTSQNGGQRRRELVFARTK
ncbi:MAG TPA: prepilin-type N-terminal cleavage/methylation domain-containing protein [Planctomycetota bacterium]|nr:prepilin-type N-terminal cleavage/methylation domain-containing protein [Planctomycetota bacterium]